MASSNNKRRILAGSFGNFVELYDFFVYGFSVPILATYFFPAGNPTVGILSTFAIYAAAFLMRPIGGILFGRFGDRLGRVKMMTITVLVMGGCTMLIGLLPTYGQIGLLATILLVIARLGQGLSMGGETSGAYSYLLESAPEGRRGTWIGVGAAMAFLPAAVVGIFILGLRTLLGDAVFEDWGWRLPFLLGGVLGLVGLYLRMKVEEPEAFVESRRTEKITDPLRTVLRTHRGPLLSVGLLSSANGLVTYTLNGYLYTYLLTVAGLGQVAALLVVSTAIATAAVLYPVTGMLADRVGRKPLLLAGTLWTAAGIYPAFLLASSGSVGSAALAALILVVGTALTTTPQFLVQAEMFPTAVRYSGHAVATNIGNALFGGTVALVSGALVSSFGTPVAPAPYIALVSVFAFFVVLRTPETRTYDLQHSHRNTTTASQHAASEPVHD
ncbi:MFS transporter [Saccharopolyspora mangrovi]|uniref:MFS transporter n=1 Tax=Saccharopolyspora mangrovi TaxID=3082379 RepID=A0ABU6ALD4_9PSEU|nr:MFS transporter [Saccharopolyspora sp. S2-29]MEB3372350.1 MFS transporter [Saccharopolyspora sp. S2-29]